MGRGPSVRKWSIGPRQEGFDRQLELSKFWGRAADCIIYPELHSTLEWQRAQVSDLSHVLIHHTNDCTQSAGCIILPEPTLEWQK